MSRTRFASIAVAVLATLAVTTGCTGDDLMRPSDAETQADVNAAALAVSMAGPSATASADLVAAMIGRMGSGATVPKLTAGSPMVIPTFCPATFDLPAGVSGTCSATGEGAGTFTFSGTLVVDGVTVALQGTMVVSASADQPPSGTRYDVSFNASATSVRGAATWTATGDVTTGAAGEVVDYDLAMTHTVTPSGGSSVAVVIVLSPTRFEETITGPLGNTVRFALDRETMTGTVRINGIEVATVAIHEGCAEVDFVNPALTDFTICAGI
jgi:hypothetical protein